MLVAIMHCLSDVGNPLSPHVTESFLPLQTPLGAFLQQELQGPLERGEGILQVVRHLGSHLQRLPAADSRSRAIVEQMKIDEQGHADVAENLGAAELPQQVKQLMKLTSKVMTILAEKI